MKGGEPARVATARSMVLKDGDREVEPCTTPALFCFDLIFFVSICFFVCFDFGFCSGLLILGLFRFGFCV